MMGRRSLRARLLTALLAATAVVWVVSALWSYRGAHHESEELLDAQLAQSARLLLAQTKQMLPRAKSQRDDDDAQDEEIHEALDQRELHPYEQALRFRVWDRKGRLRLVSRIPPPSPIAPEVEGFFDVSEGGITWRVLSAWDDDHQLRVEAFQSGEVREELAGFIATRLLKPIAVVFPLLAVVIFFVIGRELSPLATLARAVTARTPNNLDPIEPIDAPSEIRPVADALNRLLAQLARALDNERRFTGDAAHELRTPLATIRLQTQVALATADAAARAHALANVVAGVDRATRLTEQLLCLARLDPVQGLRDRQRIRAADLILAVHADLDEIVRARGRKLDVETPPDDESPELSGDPEMLQVALRNLVENATAATPPGGRITLGTTVQDHHLHLWVRDAGPGVTPEELPKLQQRFYRGIRSSTPGSGLGLSIVARIAELHGARLTLANRPKGGFEAGLAFANGSSHPQVSHRELGKEAS